MLVYLTRIVTQHWLGTILVWLFVVASMRLVAPAWDDVTHDGDLAFLPADRPFMRAEQLIAEAFPQTRSKSQIVLVVARADKELDRPDLRVADRLASRFHNRLGAMEYQRGVALGAAAERPAGSGTAEGAEAGQQTATAAFESARSAWTEATRLDEDFAPAWHNLAIVLERLGETTEAAQARDTAKELDATLSQQTGDVQPPGAGELPLVDVWTHRHEVFGSKLRSADRRAQLIVLQLANEFMATDNIRVLEQVEAEVAAERVNVERFGPSSLILGISGSAAVGGDMLRSARDSIRNTELLTVVLVVAILLMVYRSPFLVLVPLATIAVSLSVATGLLALLTQLHQVPGFDWWEFKLFKTTKIFIVVILFGSGTDFCLFLIARLREELAGIGDVPVAVATSLTRVGDALVASALTTVLGLATMFFAEFGKFRSSGPAIGLCLLVTLLACFTLAPALLTALGRWVFWPQPAGAATLPGTRHGSLWRHLARVVVRRPGRILLGCVLVLAPMATWGWSVPRRVTFDLLSELSPGRTSMIGSDLLKRHFPVGEGGPVVVLARRPGAGFGDPESEIAARAMGAVFELTKRMTEIAGVHSVRSIAEPLGDRPERISVASAAGVRKLFLRQHTATRAIFLAQAEPHRGQVTRFELVLDDNPFSFDAIQTLARIDVQLRAEARREQSFWRGAEFVFAGTTAGIRDLREVIRSDYWTITTLVTLVVFGIILLILRRPEICLYLIISVLFSYLVTIGATEIFFRWWYGPTFVGLDWKVPIFLFVILVAVGEDYNIYLVTRVIEEQRTLGLFAGLRAAITRTGAIITSCGIIMAGSFVSMIAGDLRGISELGFALTLGILLDTFVVRTILVPAFLAILFRVNPAARHAAPLLRSQDKSHSLDPV